MSIRVYRQAWAQQPSTGTGGGTADPQLRTDLTALQTTVNRKIAVNRETITANKTLSSSDAQKQHLITTTENLQVIFPSNNLTNGDSFIVKNSEDSTEDLEVNGVDVPPGDFYEAIYDGVEWVEW